MTLLACWPGMAGPSDPLSRTATESSSPPSVEEIYHTCSPRIYSLARRFLNQDADAEDVTQEVLLQVIRKLDTFRGEAALSTWLNRITVNAALLHRRKQTRRRVHEVNVPVNSSPEQEGTTAVCSQKSPDQQVLDRESQELIESAIARLPKIYRDVYVLAELENLSNGEIGDELNLAVSAVKSRLHRARLMMREMLAPHF